MARDTFDKIIAGFFVGVRAAFTTVCILFWLAVVLYLARLVFAYFLSDLSDSDASVVSIVSGNTVFSLSLFSRVFFSVFGIVFAVTVALTAIDIALKKSWQKAEESIVLCSKCAVMLLLSYLFMGAVTQDFEENGMPTVQGIRLDELIETIQE